jgi:predicted phosphoadenosine phosphosulfate sulfurtransferase
MGKKLLQRNFIDSNVYDMAMERINHTFDLFDHVSVSFSGGKDSTVCLNLTLEVARERGRLPLRVIFFDEEAIPYQTEDYVRRVSERKDIDLEWYCVPFKCRNACSHDYPSWWPWASESEDLWVRSLPPEALTEIPGILMDPPLSRISFPEANNILNPASRGTCGMIMGIRAQESLTRHRAVVRKEVDNYIIKVNPGSAWGSALSVQNNAYKVYPIYDWKTDDVWTAPKRFGWDYNLAYDVMYKAGLTAHSQRVCPAFGEEPIRALWTYATCFPEIWDKMIERVPGAQAAYRYSRTELYGYGKRPDKPEGVSWPDFVKSYIRRFNEKDQVKVAKRIAREIDAHNNKTLDPILPISSHPYTGVSWGFLLTLAIRGDFKERKQACFNLDLNNIEGHADQYAREYEQEKGRVWKGRKRLTSIR